MGKQTQEAIIAVIEAKLEMYKNIVDELKHMIEREHQAHKEIYDTIKLVDDKYQAKNDRIMKYLYMGAGFILAVEFLFKFIWNS